MTQSLGAFRAALLAGWVALSAAGFLYARGKGIPTWAAVPVLAAFLTAFPFYLAAGMATVREQIGGPRLPLFLAACAIVPYLIASLGTGQFSAASLMRLAAFAAALGLWYVVLPASPLVDIGFLALIAAVELGRYFDAVYRAPYPGIEIGTLGHVALFSIAAMVLLLERRIADPGFGFLPTRAEWWIGLQHFLYFAVIGFPLGLAIHALRFAPLAPWWKIAGTFLGFFWVAALTEEFFFRGVLQQWLEEWTGRSQVALVLTSVLFGLVHLPFRGFPNWRWALLAGVMGYFCGKARNRAGGMRAGVVTHTLAVTAWRAFFV